MAEERVQRRLAAILAADVVGYSRLMREDEAGTLAQKRTRMTAPDQFHPSTEPSNHVRFCANILSKSGFQPKRVQRFRSSIHQSCCMP